MTREFYTIQTSDVGKLFIQAFDRRWLVSDHWGMTMKQDVGKRVYQISPRVLQIENQAQFEGRKYEEKTGLASGTAP